MSSSEILKFDEWNTRVSNMRNELYSMRFSTAPEFFGFVDTASSIKALCLARKGISVPYSWIFTEVVEEYIELAQSGKK